MAWFCFTAVCPVFAVCCGAAAALTERERSCSLGLTVTHTADSPQVSFSFFPPHALSSYLFPSRSPWFDALGNNKRPIAILLSPPISQKPTTSPWSSPLLPFLSYSLSSLVSTCLLKPRRLSTCRPLSHDFQAHHFLFLTAAPLAIASEPSPPLSTLKCFFSTIQVHLEEVLHSCVDLWCMQSHLHAVGIWPTFHMRH